MKEKKIFSSYLYQLEKTPQLSNGKTNYSKHLESNFSYCPADIEKRLEKICCELLNKTQIGLNESFFEVGGHSLKVMELTAAIYNEFKVNLNIKAIFKSLTIKNMAEAICKMKRIDPNIEKNEKSEYYPLSYAQKGMYKFEDGSTIFNMTTGIIWEGTLDLERVNTVFQRMVDRHESLRTSFHKIDGKIMTHVQDQLTFSNLKIIEKCDKSLEEIYRDFIETFDLSKAPLFRIGVALLENKKAFLIFDIHHLVCDWLSLNILSEEFISFYFGQELPPLKVQYNDYVFWQQRLSKELPELREYWSEDELTILKLPTDYPRPEEFSTEGDEVKNSLDHQVVSQVNKFITKNDTTVFIFMVAIYNVILASWSRQNEIILGAPISGRTTKEFDQIIGLFANTIVLKNYPDKHKIFIEFLNEVLETSVSCYEMQDYQYEFLLNKFGSKVQPGRNMLYDAIISVHRLERSNLEIPGVSISPYSHNKGIARFDISLVVWHSEAEINYSFVYNTNLFRQETIVKVATFFEDTIKKVLNNERILLSDLSLNFKK